jgi:ribonuclease D
MHLIIDTPSLTAFCQRLRATGANSFITVDTEFIREKTYRPQICLIQVAGSQEVGLIDPLAPALNLQPLFDLLVDPHILKVFHAARQDLEIFYQLMDALPAPVFDTQIAGMVCGFGDSVSYEILVQTYAKARLDKSSRYSHWQQRPLSEKQLRYAEQDVTYLRTVYQALHDRISAQGRLPWIEEEMAELLNPRIYQAHPEDAWKRIKTRMQEPRYLARLRALAAVREAFAQRKDRPRLWIMRDQLLLEMAALTPIDDTLYQRMRGLPENFSATELGKAMLKALKEADALPMEACPTPPIMRKPSNNTLALLELLRVVLRIVCTQNHIVERLVATGDDLEALALSDAADVPAMHGWRYELFGRYVEGFKKGTLGLCMRDKALAIVDIQ